MKSTHYLIILLTSVLISSCGPLNSHVGNTTSGIQTVSSASQTEKPKYAPYGDWPLNNNDLSNSGVANNDNNKINPRNVMTLERIFRINIPGDGVMSTPTIADDTVYYASGAGRVAAVDGTTGKTVWEKVLSANGHIEAFDSSPVLTKNKLFIAQDNMFALDRKKGDILWSVPIYNYHDIPGCENFDSNIITGAQLALAGDKVIYTFGFADEAAGSRTPNYNCDHGQIVAVNQDTGHIDWRIDFTNVNGITYGAGSGGFGHAAIDTKRHIMYLGTSNSYTAPSSPYADALIAIDYNTGKVIWYYQFYDNDVWSQNTGNTTLGKDDLDVRGHPQLFSLMVNGQSVDFVSVTGKDGTLRIFTSEQESVLAKPIAHVQLGPATASSGAISLNPALKDGVIYVPSSYAVDPTSGMKASLDFIVNVYGQTAILFGFAQTNLIAIDLQKLITYGMAHPAESPVCYGAFAPPLCNGQLPLDQGIIIYDKSLGNTFPLNSSGLAYNNGVLYFPDTSGVLYTINADTGNIIGGFGVAPASPPIFGLLPYNLLTGGVSIGDNKIYVPYGILYDGNGFGDGGLVGYALPSKK